MRYHRLSLVIGTTVLLAATATQASSIHKKIPVFGRSDGPSSYLESPGGVGIYALPSSPDNWLGGAQNWSHADHWSNGLPDGNSDVYIGTGNDNVTLDIDASVQSLTLGGPGDFGASKLAGDGAGRTLAIAGALTINRAGQLNGYGDTYSAASLTNSGLISLERTSSMTISGDVNNNLAFYLDLDRFGSANNTLTVAGAFNNASSATFALQMAGDVANVGQFNNQGLLELYAGTTLNLTNQPNGITEILPGSQWLISDATVNADGQNAFAHLTTIDGRLAEGFSSYHLTDITPLGGTLTISQYGSLQPQGPVGYNIHGDVLDAGSILIGYNASTTAPFDVSGTLTISPGAQFEMNGNHAGNVMNLINSGEISLANGATLNIVNSSGIPDVAAGTTYIIGYNSAITANGQPAFANLTSVEGRLVLASNQTTTINPNAGVLTIANGGQLAAGYDTLQVNGELRNNGLIDISSNLNFGTMLMVDQFTAGNGSFLQIDVSGEQQVGTLQVSGPVSLAGTLIASLINGFVPNVGDTFKFLIFTPGSLSGTFTSVEGGGENWGVVYDNTDGYVELVAGGTTTTTGTSLTTTGTTPEPSTILLLGSGILALIGKFRGIK